MHLMFTLDAAGKRVYTLNKVAKNHKGVSEVTKSAHPARFSPDDKYSRYVFDSPPYKDQNPWIILLISIYVTDTESRSRSGTRSS